MGRPKGKGNIPDEIIEQVKLLLYSDDTLIGKQIQEGIESTNPDAKAANYSLRAYQAIKEAVLDEVLKLKEGDKLWNLGIANNEHFTAQAINQIFKVQEWCNKEFKGGINQVITVRQARWIALLYERIDKPRLLWKVSYIYTVQEIMAALAHKKEIDTTALDKCLIGNIEANLQTYFRESFNKDKKAWMNQHFLEIKLKRMVNNGLHQTQL